MLLLGKERIHDEIFLSAKINKLEKVRELS